MLETLNPDYLLDWLLICPQDAHILAYLNDDNVLDLLISDQLHLLTQFYEVALLKETYGDDA